MSNAPCSMSHARERGLALMMTVIITALLSGIVLGVGLVSVRQVTIAHDLLDSAAAIVAADAGTEHALFEFWRNDSADVCEDASSGCVFKGTFPNTDASYKVTYDFSADPAEDPERWISSVGESRDIRRAFKLSDF